MQLRYSFKIPGTFLFFAQENAVQKSSSKIQSTLSGLSISVVQKGLFASRKLYLWYVSFLSRRRGVPLRFRSRILLERIIFLTGILKGCSVEILFSKEGLFVCASTQSSGATCKVRKLASFRARCLFWVAAYSFVAYSLFTLDQWGIELSNLTGTVRAKRLYSLLYHIAGDKRYQTIPLAPYLY